MNPWHDFIRILANLQETLTVADRRELVRTAGLLDRIGAELEWQGSPKSFVQELLSKLHAQGKATFVGFVQSVRDNYPWGIADQQLLETVIARLSAIQDAQWQGLRARLPRLYIAHGMESAEDPFLAELAAGLEATGFEVIVAPAAATGGDGWRARLLQGIGLCDGGLIVLDDRALTTVSAAQTPEDLPLFQDATLLRWRAWRDAKFVLAPICRQNVTGAALQQAPWARLDLDQLPTVIASTAQDVLAQVGPRVAVLQAEAPATSWVVRLELALAQHFAGLPPQLADDVLQRLGDLPGNSTDQYGRERRLARAVLHHGLGGFQEVLDRARGGVLTAGRLGQVFELVGPSWVDMRAAALIPRYTRRPDAERMFALNADYPAFTGEMYLLQACQDPGGVEFRWRAIQVNEDDVNRIVDEEIRPNLIALFNSVKTRDYPDLQRRFRNDPNTLNRKVDEILNRKLRAWEAEGRPVFLLFAPDMFDADKLAAIRNRYPSLTFFLLAGSQASQPPLPNADLLTPALPPDGEEIAKQMYDNAWDLIPAQ